MCYKFQQLEDKFNSAHIIHKIGHFKKVKDRVLKRRNGSRFQVEKERKINNKKSL